MSEASRGLDRKPRVLVTRAAGQASALAEELRRLGAEPVIVPILDIVSPDSFEELDAALAQLASFDWLLFTSANAVQALWARADRKNITLNFAGIKIAAIGAATARAVESIGQPVDMMPQAAVAESMAKALIPFARRPNGSPNRFLLVRAQNGREHLPEVLREAGADVTIAPAYKTQVPAEGAVALREYFEHSAGPPDVLTVTSSSAAKNFFALLASAKLEFGNATAIVSIGPITSSTLCELGHPPDAESPEASIQALAGTTMEYLRIGVIDAEFRRAL